MRNSMKMILVLGLGACFVATTAAQAATIHACVKPKSGATRIVKAQAKCGRGEQKLSWNTAGARGPAGTKGANGTNGAAGGEGRAGANGAAAVYTVSSSGAPQPIPPSGQAVVLTKVLPPGSYAVIAKTTLVAQENKAARVSGFCVLTDTPGTSGTVEAALLDLTGWEAPLVEEEPTEFSAESPLLLTATVTSGVTSTLTMACVNLLSSPKLKSSFPQMQATAVAAVL